MISFTVPDFLALWQNISDVRYGIAASAPVVTKRGVPYSIGVEWVYLIITILIKKYIKETSCQKYSNQDNLIDIFVHDEKLNNSLNDLEINGCYFKSVDFSSIIVKNCDFIDCIFENCNLIGCDFSNKSIHRVCFRYCNLGSTDYIMSSVKDVLIDDCKCDYINFSDSKIDTLEIQDSLFREARFINIKLKNNIFTRFVVTFADIYI